MYEYIFAELRSFSLLSSALHLAVRTRPALGGLVYVRRGDEDCVIATSADLLRAIPTRFGDLRDRVVIPGTPARAERLEMRNARGFVRLERQAGLWQVTQQVLGTGLDTRMILGPTEVLPTEQGLGGHRRGRGPAGLIRVLTSDLVPLDRVQELG